MKLSAKLIDFVEEHKDDDVHSLALQSKKYPDIDIELAIRQITGRKITKDKIPTWYACKEIIYPRHISLEQSSSESTALYKASLYSGNSMIDLTGGMGVDFSFMAKRYNQATYVEQQSELVDIATCNFDTLNLNNVNVVNADSVEYLASSPSVDLIYIDPARRDNTGRKTVLIEDCTPNILEIEELLEEKADIVMIKLSPMLDISLAVKSLRNISQVHVISVDNECKELLLIRDKTGNRTQYHSVNISNDKTDIFSFYKEDEETLKVEHVSDVNKYLYEPNASILKAGAYKSVANIFSLNKLHPSSHLYTSDVLHPEFHGRTFQIKETTTLSRQDIKVALSKIGKANIAIRNFPLSVQEIRKKTGIKEGGDIYIFATTLADDRKVLLICEKA